MVDMKTTTRPLLREDRGDNGFTLVEILVVIIIIGILAAIAIPIYINQQRAARDAATTSDMRNLVTAVETAHAHDPDAKNYAIFDSPTGSTGGSGERGANLDAVWIQVGDGTRMEVSKTPGTRLILGYSAYGGDGAYVAYAYNPDGLEYRHFENSYNKPGTALAYDSLQGGIREY